MQPTAAVLPQGEVTRQSVVPAPPILVPQLRDPAAAAERESMVTTRGLDHAAMAACLRNLRLESPSPAARCDSSTRSLS